MREEPTARFLPDGKRLLLQHGPIDLVVQAFGDDAALREAYAAAIRRFDGLLAELCQELDLLRSPADRLRAMPKGPIARRMVAAVSPFGQRMFITPMAAVAGAVAEEIITVMAAAAPLTRAYVNNGGDIALHLSKEQSFKIGLVDRPDLPSLFGTTEIREEDDVRGIATSGYLGRSFSLGIAEAVTILAPTAAMADAAATVIANAVDLPDHPAIQRVPANSLQVDNDLGAIRVTQTVGHLTGAEIETALARGLHQAGLLQKQGLIAAAALHLKGISRALDSTVLTSHRRPELA
ncbi:MAG TPA: UPF0280 family protein [Xanthobacteraceae bacterium]|jgi:ApbE superfamily uncharacterized protein (UPF0280 family)|nr:UPF0280 family protein [Xanthobacteraceae bacterium]